MVKKFSTTIRRQSQICGDRKMSYLMIIGVIVMMLTQMKNIIVDMFVLLVGLQAENR